MHRNGDGPDDGSFQRGFLALCRGLCCDHSPRYAVDAPRQPIVLSPELAVPFAVLMLALPAVGFLLHGHMLLTLRTETPPPPKNPNPEPNSFPGLGGQIREAPWHGTAQAMKTSAPPAADLHAKAPGVGALSQPTRQSSLDKV